jgi:predicted PurR-regulated permease PerM
MKINWNVKYNTISVYSVISVCTIIVFYLSLSKIDIVTSKLSEAISILQPFIMGFIIAYLLDFLLRFFENKVFETKWFKKTKIKSNRALGLALTYLIAFLFIKLFIQFVLPQLIDSIVTLVNDIPNYISKSTDLVNELFNKLNLSDEYLSLVNENLKKLVDYTIKVGTDLLPVLGNLVKNIVASIWNIVLGFIISIYLLKDKERFLSLSRKLAYAFLSKSKANKVIEIVNKSNDTFGKFLMGKLLDSFIVGVITFVSLTIFNMPYATLISVIIGVTNIIPFFGPFIGTIPSFLIILIVSPIQAFWFLVLILVIQQIEGNIVVPRILGKSMGISAFWILFAIMVAGKFFGIAGMILGVPMFAVVYSLIKELIEDRLKEKGLKVETEDYMNKKIYAKKEGEK